MDDNAKGMRMSIYDIKEDWDKEKRRWEAWWNHEMYDRVPIQVTAPKAGVKPEPVEPVDFKQQWTDIDFMIRRTLEEVRCRYYGGEALPCFWHNWSAGHALLFGCEPHFEANTVWVDPAPTGEDGWPVLDTWRKSPWWSWIHTNTLTAAQASKGRYFVMPGWGNNAGDTLALARGVEQLLMDIALEPQRVKRAVKQASDMWIEITSELWKLITPEITGMEGSLDYCGCWSPGRTLTFDCDVAYNISPQSFADIFLPPLIKAMRTANRRIFHVDGIGVSHHLELLLEVPELDAIQWMPGDGHFYPVTQWIPLIRRVQEKGKSILVYVRPEEIEPLMQEVKHEGLLLSTWVGTEKEARELVKRVARLS